VRVALFAHRYPPALGGAESYAARLAAYHGAAGDTVQVHTTTADDLEAFWHTGRREFPAGESSGVHRYRPLRFPARRYVLKAASLVPYSPWQALTLPCNPVCPGIWLAARRVAGVDAVHAMALPYSFPIACAWTLARRQRAAFLLTPFLHLGDPADPRDRTRRQYLQRPHRWLLRQADRVFVMTNLEREAVLELGVPERRVVLQGLGVEPAECTGGDRRKARQQWGIDDTTFAVGHLANNSAEKGSVDLLHAAARAGGKFRLVLAGPEMPNFRRAWERFDCQQLVTRLGPLSDSAKRDFFAGIDAFALPSRSDSFGLVLLEAWANAKPVVAYRAGGPGEIIRNSSDGLLVRCGDTAGLAGALGSLAADRAAAGTLGRAGSERVAVEFDWAGKLALVRASATEAIGEKRAAATIPRHRPSSAADAP
jgi:glycosyltransferase involved in cell wall biosynthesis